MVPSRVEAAGARAVAPLVPDDEFETPPLPREHPKWIKDSLLVSQRAKQLLECVKPVVVLVYGFWDHTVRVLSVGACRIAVDSSGSYRIEP